MNRIRTAVTIVDVPVLPLGPKNTPLLNLPQNAFHVIDDGTQQQVVAFDNEPRPVSLGIVVDTSDPEAVGQAHRASEVIANSVIGATGEAAIFIAGPEPRQIVPFTSDKNRISDALRHLPVNAEGPDITEPLSLATLRTRARPKDRNRALLVITREKPRGGKYAQAIIEASMNDAVPVFRIVPNRPKVPLPPNPISPKTRGPGVGSNREIHPAEPIDSRGQPVPTPGTVGNFDLRPLLSALSNIMRRKGTDYVDESGGISFSATNDRDFDEKLSTIGDALRSIYHLYFHPDDLGPTPEIHNISIALNTKVDRVAYRHTYVGFNPR